MVEAFKILCMTHLGHELVSLFLGPSFYSSNKGIQLLIESVHVLSITSFNSEQYFDSNWSIVKSFLTSFRSYDTKDIIRALASARGSVARRAQRPSRKPLEGPKGPRVAKTRESEGPKGPRTSKAQSVLASATICFSRFSQKSRFSWLNLSTFMTAKMHENFNRVLYLRYEDRVKK